MRLPRPDKSGLAMTEGWIPAFAGMTGEEAGMTGEEAGMTGEEAGMT